MSRRSGSKQNLNTSYYDLTSPLSNLEKVKQKSLLKSSIHNSFLGKLQMYSQNDGGNSSVLMSKSEANFTGLKAGSMLYKLPEFTVPEINYEISQAIKQKTFEIKEQMVANLPNIMSSSTSLPSLVPRSSNYNPKKLQNILGHRSSILELQTWIKASLSKSLPTTAQQLIEYKQMIMGVGMKELIRIISARCMEEGKLVEQVWELTWGICKQLIQHMGLRAKKCEQVLAEEIIEFNKGCKRNYFEKEKQLIDLRKRVKEYQEQHIDLNARIEQLTKQNESISLENNKNFLENNYYNEEFLNVLEENLAMYLHLGDKNKRDWIKKMYKQVARARQSIQTVLKQKVNKTVENRVRQESVFGDQEEVKQLQVDQEGNFVVDSRKNIVVGVKREGERAESSQKKDVSAAHPQEEFCETLKGQLAKEFESKQAEIQTDTVEFQQIQTQCQVKLYEQKQVQTENNPLEQTAMNTDLSQIANQKSTKTKDPKQKKQKGSIVKNSKQKLSKRGSQFNDSMESKGLSSLSSTNEVALGNMSINMSDGKSGKITEEDEEKSPRVEMIEYVCKDCFGKRCKQEALIEIQYEEEQKIQRQQQLQLKQQKNDKTQQNDSQQMFSSFSQKEKLPTVVKNPTNRKSNLSRMSSLKFQEKKSNKDLSRQEGSSEKSLEKLETQNKKIKKVLSNIEENKSIEDSEYEKDVQNKNGKGKRGMNWESQGVDSNGLQSGYPYDMQNYPQLRSKASDSVHSGANQSPNRRNQRRDSSILHDISFKKEIEQISNLKEAAYNLIKTQEQSQQGSSPTAKLPLTTKEPYFKFFTEQITQANKQLTSQITYQQTSNQTILNNYFNMVQQVNSIPESRIIMSQKQMLTMIEKNLMPIIMQLLNTVKKSIMKKTVDQTIRTFHSLPFVLMNKLSTKYGVKILAIKNMKLLLSSLKKIELVTDRYKSIRLMLFTDCRAMYSEDLFVYLLVLAIVAPHLDIQRAISYEEVNEVREICEKYLTTEKRVYEEFDNMTKQALELNNTQQKLGNLKLAPLLRSILTSYRMVKINRIEEVGFVFLMLKKENYVEYLTFSYFMSCFKIETETKVKIVKTFLANCDLRAKNKRIAISESGFSRFLIRCPEFNFEFLNNAILRQRNEINRLSSTSTTKKAIQTNKRMSEQPTFSRNNSINQMKSLASLIEGEGHKISNHSHHSGSNQQSSSSQLQTEKAILLASQKQLKKQVSMVVVQQKEEEADRQTMQEAPRRVTEQSQQQSYTQPQLNQHQVTTSIQRSQKRHLSLDFAHPIRASISQKVKHYSYFTYQISKFLQNQQETKFMSMSQKEFVLGYLLVHVMACEVEEMIGFIDYFSNDMLEIVCCDVEELRIGGGVV